MKRRPTDEHAALLGHYVDRVHTRSAYTDKDLTHAPLGNGTVVSLRTWVPPSSSRLIACMVAITSFSLL